MVRGKRDVTKEPKSAKSKNKDEEESSTSDSEEYDLQDIMAELKSQRRDLVIRLEKVTTEVSPMKIKLTKTNESRVKQHKQKKGSQIWRIRCSPPNGTYTNLTS